MPPDAVQVPSGTELPRVATALPGPRATALCELLASVECPALTTRRARRAERTGAPHDPIVWTAAHGANVTDVDGNVYVDMTAGFGAALLGYGHSAVRAAVHAQTDRMMHALGDVYPSDTKIALESRLASLAPWRNARVILGLSGADAVEAALKTAVLASGRAGVLAFEGAYHGLSHGPLAACGYSAAFREPFQRQLNPDVTFVPYPARGDAERIHRAIGSVRAALSTGRIGAVLIEPILGRGGAVEADIDAVATLLALARDAGAVTIADEIMTGTWRAGPWLSVAANTWPCPPDIVCVGKALGGTMPISACLVRDEVAAAWGDPMGEAIHTSTFLGNPLACSAALATLDVLDDPRTLARRADVVADLWNAALEPLVARALPSDELRLVGRDLLIGLYMRGGLVRALGVVRALLLRGFVALPGGTNGVGCLVLTPSIATTREQIVAFAGALEEALREVAP